jgi:hypothetical protein
LKGAGASVAALRIASALQTSRWKMRAVKFILAFRFRARAASPPTRPKAAGETRRMEQSCQKCGAEVNAGQAFCPKCGASKPRSTAERAALEASAPTKPYAAARGGNGLLFAVLGFVAVLLAGGLLIFLLYMNSKG